MAKHSLPTGIQSFRKLRERECYYVDKTGYALRLFREGTHYFLARPRRFGKSLFVDTLRHLFEGHQALFEGLAAYDRWDWSVRYPVVRLDFAGLVSTKYGDLDEHVQDQLAELEADTNVEPHRRSTPLRFRNLVRSLHRQSGHQVCVLVDEYDKPILDCLEDPEQARANRDYLRGLYGMIKSCDEDIRFVFLTGVSKFSKVNLFSGLNNLIDVTLEPTYSAICGYTEDDLDNVFAPELPGLDRKRIREWYNGYSWGAEKVYNPYDLLLLFRKRAFNAWWFETGTPTFLLRLLAENAVSSADLDGMLASEQLLSTFDVGRIAPEALLFQTGYLTLGREEWRDNLPYYRLVYPNLEVRQSLNLSLRDFLTGYDRQREAHSRALSQLLRAGDLEGLEGRLRALFASIPSDWHRRNRIAEYEGYYASVLHAYFAGLGLDVTVEDSSSGGRLDMAVRAGGRVYLFEFKLADRSERGAALAELKARGYANKYRHLGEPIHQIGVEFSAKTRTLSGFETELA